MKSQDNIKSPAWDIKTVAKLHELWDKGLTAQEISLKVKRSRCAVLGKLHRLGLSKKHSARAMALPMAKARPMAKRRK